MSLTSRAVKDRFDAASRLDNRVVHAGPKKVTLCGSTKFKKAFLEWNRRLTLEGNLVYTVAFWTHTTGVPPTPKQKEALDVVHKEKIRNSDEIFVIDVGGYVGESTRQEISFAKSLGKTIRRLSLEYPQWSEDLCQYVHEAEIAGL